VEQARQLQDLVLIGDANPHAPEYVWDGKAIGIDWKAECAGLKKQGIKVYGVHCGGSSSSRPFYQDVASTTGGQYLPLDSLQTMTDTFAALCLREADATGAKLKEYKERVTKRDGRLTADSQRMFSLLESTTVTIRRSVVLTGTQVLAARSAAGGG